MKRELTIKLTANAKKLLKLRYLKKGESTEQLFRRVAKAIALADVKYLKKSPFRKQDISKKLTNSGLLSLASHSDIKKTEKDFYEMLVSLDFLPNSPVLFNAGRELGQLSACFVLPIEDDLESIFTTLTHTALIHQSGGGTGFSFSNLRPKGSKVSSTGGTASGPISFMKIYDCATEQIKQGGRRRGANMGVLNVHHPDIEEFIKIKQNGGMRNFNLSVAVTDRFMNALKGSSTYCLVSPKTRKTVMRVKAKKFFDSICKAAHACGDPGILFIDRINRKQPTPLLGKIRATNPCGEVPLLPYEACTLGSINLNNFVSEKKIDYSRLKDTVWKAVHFLDNVCDVSKYPVEEIESAVLGSRKIGLGVMGFADMLIKLNVSYSSKKALHIADELMSFINSEAKKASVELAEKRGVFPNFRGSVYDTGKKRDRVRNATRTSIAPTGSISMIAGCSPGIEPLFALEYSRLTAEGIKLNFKSKHFVKLAKKEGLSKERIGALLSKGFLDNKAPHKLKKIFVTARQITPKQHVLIQAAFQKHTDNSVSKTVNLPKNAKVSDVKKAFLTAWKANCKGIAVFRDKDGLISCPECEQ